MNTISNARCKKAVAVTTLTLRLTLPGHTAAFTLNPPADAFVPPNHQA